MTSRRRSVCCLLALGFIGCGDAEDIRAACARWAACSGASFRDACTAIERHRNLSDSEGTQARLFAVRIDCVLAADDCSAVEACLSAPVPECTIYQDAHCVGDVMVTCQGTIYDCGAAGLGCFDTDATPGHARCGSAACDEAFPPRCDGTTHIFCNYGAVTAETCRYSEIHPTPSGLEVRAYDSCREVEGWAACAGGGASCDSTQLPVCEGDAIVACTEGYLGRYDCSALGVGITCRTDGVSPPHCVSAAEDCSPIDPERCDDGVITYCYMNGSTTYDCRAYGYTGCTVADGNADCTR